MDSKKQQNLEETYERILKVGFCTVPYEDLSDIIGPDPMVYGTAKDERILSFEGVEALFRSQYEQMGNMKPAYDRKRIDLRISNDGNNACIIEEITFSLSSDEEIHSIFMRATCVMEYLDNQWKLTHWHTSTPVDTENDPWHMEEWKREKEKLQRLVDEQTVALKQNNLELQIEAALERVRSKSLAMHKTAELQSVIHTVHQELLNLNLSISGGSFIIINKEIENDLLCWGSGGTADYSEIVHIPHFEKPFYTYLLNKIKSDPGFFTEEYTHEEKVEFFTFLFQHEPWSNLDSKQKEETLSAPGGYTRSCVVSKHTSIFIINHFGEKFSEAENAILRRFGKVFEQSYTRFLDLQKAEAQAREAQIEAALERVRAQTMAMHSSEDVGKCVVKMFAELTALGVDDGTRFGIGILNHDNENNQLWTARKDGQEVNMHIGHLDMSWHPLLKSAREAWKAQVPIHKYVLEGEDLLAYYRMLNKAPDYKIQIPIDKLPKKEIQHCFIFEHGFFYAFTPHEFQPDLIKITKRFSSLFEQTYRRYLDLVRAEEQAREAQIEAALERVRARSMAMQKSDELHDVLSVLFEQFDVLGIHPVNVFLSLFSREDKTLTYRATGTGGSRTQGQQVVSLDSLDVWQQLFEKWKNDNSESVEVIYYDKEILPTLFGLLEETFSSMPENERLIIDDFPEGGYTAHGYTPFGYIGFNHKRMPTGEEKDILTKFASEFGRIYQRFLDIERAEAQSRESEIQLALERVRARTMAMQHSDELTEASEVLDQQVRALGIETWGCAFHIYADDPEGDYEWFSSREGTLPFYKTPRENFFLKFYEKGKAGELFHVEEFLGEDCRIHYDYLMTIPVMGDALRAVLAAGGSLPESQYDHIAFFKHGFLLFITYQQVPESHDIFKRFAKVFDQTYTRFLDLQKAEAQAREAQIEAALERVRSKTMGMQRSEQLGETASLLFKQFDDLGIKVWSSGFQIWKDDNISTTAWMSSAGGEVQQTGIRLPHTEDPYFINIYNARYAPDHLFVMESKGKELEDTYRYMFNIPEWKKAFGDIEDAGFPIPKYQITHCVYFSHGYLMLITHESYPEYWDIFKRFGKVFEQTYTRFLDLQKAEEQARVAEIELALERVRARTMAMHKSEELAETAAVLFEQLRILGNTPERINLGIFKEKENLIEWWITTQDGLLIENNFITKFDDHPVLREMYKAWKEEKKSNVIKLIGEDVKDWVQYITKVLGMPVNPELVKEQRILSSAYFSQGLIGTTTSNPLPMETIGLLERFAAVFQQTYTRFLDLQKAEAQAREARIEAALEKIRSRTMGMQSSEELPGVANLLFLEVQALGIPAWSCGYCILLEDRKSSTCIMSSEGTLQKPFLLPHYGEVSFEEWDEFVHGKETFFTQELGSKAIESHYDFMKSLPQLTPIFKEIEKAGFSLPTYQINHLCKFAHGFLLFITYENVPDAYDIFKRFTKVFDQTYTRFLDLKKAEEQARESQIEASLERVRAKALAMHSSDDLRQTITAIFEELKGLNIKTIRLGLGLVDPDKPEGEIVTSRIDENDQIIEVSGKFKLEGHSVLDKVYDHFKQQQDYFPILEGEEINGYYAALQGFVNVQGQGTDVKHFGCFLYFEEGCLYAWAAEPHSQGQISILKKFSRVVEITYRRYKELTESEYREREAVKQASLDRVRAEIASMRTADDLEYITPIIWKELTILSIPFIRCGVFIINEKEKIVEAYLSSPEGSSLGVLHLPFRASELTYQTVEAWRKGLTYRQHWNKEDFVHWINLMMEQDQIQDSSTYQGTAAPPESLDLHFVPFTQGMLYVGAVSPLDEMELELVQALAKAFSIAYARYEDFVKLEQAKAEVESAMSELKATQSQLVQQEKLASLGQLTAGIAHEIKNPLNFVNNFSELSSELIDEAFEELEKIADSEAKEETLAILKDVKENLIKVHEHGSRANGIVTSMLQHSRGGSGKMEPTDLNALINEYVNLSFHGMRAGKNPIGVELKFELDESIDKVKLVSEDFSRVIVNLCNNAFDAMRGKKYQVQSTNYNGGEIVNGNYVPKLKVSTLLESGRVRICFEDNGPGIPDEIMDKILQPFFTTKKGTEGTGLGLSITNDIIKAHGGKLEMKSSSGEGSTFIIQLPT